MYLIFRCDCGRVLSSRDDKKTKKCTCGKTVRVKDRRILSKVEDVRDVPSVVQEFQEVIYHSTGFKRANEL